MQGFTSSLDFVVIYVDGTALNLSTLVCEERCSVLAAPTIKMYLYNTVVHYMDAPKTSVINTEESWSNRK